MMREKHKYLAPLASSTAQSSALPGKGFDAPSFPFERDDLPTLESSQKITADNLHEPNHWRDVDHAVKMALALDSKDASNFLKSLAIRRSSLYQEVVWFLGAQDGLDGFMEVPLGKNLPSFFQDLESITHLKTSNGDYPVLDILGEGGMGRVYLVEQQQAFGRKVALKTLRAELKEKTHLARFENEFRLLANLNHPNIAHLYEGGKTQDGKPFFTMEYVEGLPIDRHCRKYRLNLENRLEIFLQVCFAVAYAHEKGVIHRDIKPGNILVSCQGDSFLPKVIDFGIAKSTFAGLTQPGLHTRTDQLIGTPIYMSPEQIDREIWDVDWRSDVYALGVLLYELLTGFPILDPKRLGEMPLSDAIKAIVELEDIHPSNRVRDAGDDHVGKEFGIEKTSKWYAKVLQGDLDWIVRKAMAKDRRQRYENVEALINDIRAYLGGFPVQAYPEGRLYRLRKFMDRNRSKVKLVFFTTLAFLFSTAVFLWFQLWYNATKVKKPIPAHRVQVFRILERGFPGCGKQHHRHDELFQHGELQESRQIHALDVPLSRLGAGMTWPGRISLEEVREKSAEAFARIGFPNPKADWVLIREEFS